jgi:hypothetical protein
MSKGVITLPEALKIFESGQTFSLRWVQADRKRGTGGKISFEETVQKCDISQMADSILKKNNIKPDTKRDPSHYDHKTRNIYIPHDRSIKKVHIMLMLEINEKTILL